MSNTVEEIKAISEIIKVAQETEQPLGKITITWENLKQLNLTLMEQVQQS